MKRDYEKAIIEKIEKELNKYPESPFTLHDMSVIGLRFIGNKLRIKFSILQWVDSENIFSGLEIKDGDSIILDVEYDGIKIKDIQCGGKVNFNNFTVKDFSEENGEINLFLYDYDQISNCKFAFESYKWSFCTITPQKEYDEYLESCEKVYSKGKTVSSKIEKVSRTVEKEDKIINVEKSINVAPIPPFVFNQTVNVEFFKDRVYIRFALNKKCDENGLLNELLTDGQYAILDAVFLGVNVKDIYFSESVNFYCGKICDFSEKNGIVTVAFFKRNDKEENFVCEFSFESYEWKIFKIINEQEYVRYENDVKNGVSYIVKTGSKTYENVETELARLPVPEFELKED